MTNEKELPEELQRELETIRRHAIALLISTERLLQTTPTHGTIRKRPSFTIGATEIETK